MVLLSIPGLFRTILIIIAVIVIVRFIGRFMVAKRSAAEEERRRREKILEDEERMKSERSAGKVRIEKNKNVDAEDVDFEEIK